METREDEMEGRSGRRLALTSDKAREILDGFLIDEAAKEYIVSLITSAKAPDDEVSRLYDLGRSDPLALDGEDSNHENNDGEDDDDTLQQQTDPMMAPIQPVMPDIEHPATARDLLYGFNIQEELKDFLIPMITSGTIPEEELQRLYNISLNAGSDDFEMQMACAKSLRDTVLERSYSDDLTVYLGLARQYERVAEEPESANTYWPLAGSPALNDVSPDYGGSMRALERQGQEFLNGLRRASISTDMDDDEGYDHIQANALPADVPPQSNGSNGDSIGEITGLGAGGGAGAVKKTKSRRPPTTVGNIELICPLPAKDGSVCNKHFYDGKPYRSVQEHIRRAHPDNYIPKLPATKESFELIVNAALGPAQEDPKIEVVCPLLTKDGSTCGKRCFDGKAYRSMQEHIRKAHPLHYIPGLHANEESFRMMVNKQPGEGPQGSEYQVVRPADLSLPVPKKQPAVKKAKKSITPNDGPNDQVPGVVRPSDLSLPAMSQQPAAKRAKESMSRSPAKSPFFADLGPSSNGYEMTDPTVGLLPAHSVFGDTFGGDSFLPQFDVTHNSPGGGVSHLRNGMDSTISRSLFPQHFSDLAQSPSSAPRKRKRDEPNTGGPDQTLEPAISQGFNASIAGQYDPFMQSMPSQDFQDHLPSSVSPEVLEEMSDILNELHEEVTQQEPDDWELGVMTDGHRNPPFDSTDGHMLQPYQEASSQEQPVRQDIFGPTAGHYNPPLESTFGQVLQPKSIPFKAPGNTPTKSKTPQSKAASHFFGTPNAQKKIDEARTAAITPSPNSKKSSRPARGTVSALPIPPLSAERFGLVQEEFASDPFRLLVAVTFLVRTPGRVAIPVFRQLMERYPTPEALAAADPADIEAMMHHLGLSNQRTETIQKYARIWLERPPCKDVRYGVKNYPQKGDGKDVRAGEVFGPEDSDAEKDMTLKTGSPDNYDSAKENDPRAKTKARGFGTSWEIGHLTSGRYALDSWRIFCRDVLLGRAEDWKGQGRDPSFQPEWMRVLPEDKELRACLRWMWMREGWEWDAMTGEKVPLGEELRLAVDEGRVAYDSSGQLQIVDKGNDALAKGNDEA
ncbi:hypothetical protein VMCG_01156 [Cytospora schulzeri]|uniref:HhH-GPD domain-containing protein n=1 Tax=Cytospora schulzeri TaxID=448051 RepID=A0A423X5X5_9PEZI|nr:hypothetical protein VMCG_01156 [Valsa malicola]